MSVLVGAIRRLGAAAGLAFAQLRHHRFRTVLSILGIVLAVLTITLLAGTGIGVLETGESQFEAADRDLWMTSGPVSISPLSGGFENSLYDAHTVSAAIAEREGVRTAVPIGFQTVYVSDDGESFDSIIATGVSGTGQAVSISEGEGFSGGDTHYAGGSYDGEMTHEVIIDQSVAERYDIEVGDTLYIGGTVRTAEQNEFTVVGFSSTFSRFLGTPTVTTRLSELQTITGSDGLDSATFITITVDDGADVEAVQSDIQSAYPAYEVRTNAEQLEAVLQNQALVLAGAVTLVVLAFVAGVALTANLLTLVVHQQREALAALSAIGISRPLLVGTTAGQGLAIGAIGGLVGVLATPPAAIGLNSIAAELTGFAGLVQLEPWVFAVGFGVATGIGCLAGGVSTWRLLRLPSIDQLT